MDKRIVVVRERWAFIGNYHPKKGAAPAYLVDAFNIRQYGTTAGLGQLALMGPTKDTKLDPCGTVILDDGGVLFSIKCAV